MKNLALAILVLGTTAGCAVEQRNYETDPVVVSTRSGDVTCQLYSKRIVMWDEAIDIPQGMRLSQADEVCKYAGMRQKEGKDPRITHPIWAPQAAVN